GPAHLAEEPAASALHRVDEEAAQSGARVAGGAREEAGCALEGDVHGFLHQLGAHLFVSGKRHGATLEPLQLLPEEFCELAHRHLEGTNARIVPIRTPRRARSSSLRTRRSPANPSLSYTLRVFSQVCHAPRDEPGMQHKVPQLLSV